MKRLINYTVSKDKLAASFRRLLVSPEIAELKACIEDARDSCMKEIIDSPQVGAIDVKEDVRFKLGQQSGLKALLEFFDDVSNYKER